MSYRMIAGSHKWDNEIHVELDGGDLDVIAFMGDYVELHENSVNVMRRGSDGGLAIYPWHRIHAIHADPLYSLGEFVAEEHAEGGRA